MIHAKKALFGKIGKVLDLGHLDFDIVSNFDIRISYFAGLGIFTTVESALQIRPFMQNKAKFRKSQVNVNKVLAMDYEQMDTWSIRKKQSQTNPNKAKSKKAKMNVTSILTVGYENNMPFRAPKKQSQISKRQKTMQTSLPKGIMKETRFWATKKQTQNKPKQTQTKPTCRVVASGEAGSKVKKCCSPPLYCGISKEKMIFCNLINRKYQFNIIAGRMSNNKTI